MSVVAVILVFLSLSLPAVASPLVSLMLTCAVNGTSSVIDVPDALHPTAVVCDAEIYVPQYFPAFFFSAALAVFRSLDLTSSSLVLVSRRDVDSSESGQRWVVDNGNSSTPLRILFRFPHTILRGVGLWAVHSLASTAAFVSNGSSVTDVNVVQNASAYVLHRPAMSLENGEFLAHLVDTLHAGALITVLPSNNSLVPHRTQLLINAAAAHSGSALLAPATCNVFVYRDQSPTPLMTFFLENTTDSYDISSSRRMLLDSARGDGYKAFRVSLSVAVACSVPLATRSLLLATTLLEASANSTPVAASWYYASGPLPSSVHVFVLPDLPAPSFPTLADVAIANSGDSSVDEHEALATMSMPFVVPIAVPAIVSAPPSDWNVTARLAQQQWSVGLFILQQNHESDVTKALALAERTGRMTYTLVASSTTGWGNVVGGRVSIASAAPTATLVSEKTVVCGFTELIDASTNARFSWATPSPTVCAVYVVPRGVESWIYRLVACVLGSLFVVMLFDDLLVTFGECRSAAVRQRQQQLQGNATEQLQQSAVTVSSAFRRLLSWTGGPASPYRTIYIRFCAFVMALWDLVAILCNICFIIFCLATMRHLTLLIAMVAVALGAVIFLAIRVNVVTFAMPSRAALRASVSKDTLAGLDAQQSISKSTQLDHSVASHTKEFAIRRKRRPPPLLMPTSTNEPHGDTAAADELGAVGESAPSSQPLDDGTGRLRKKWRRHVERRLLHYPLASHFWPGVSILVLLVDDMDVDINYTTRPRQFWFGLQRWVQDVPSLGLALWFLWYYPGETNTASAAQVFVAAAGILFGYCGFLTAAAVPFICVASRCCCGLRQSTLEEWLRERTGLHAVESTHHSYHYGTGGMPPTSQRSLGASMTATPRMIAPHGSGPSAVAPPASVPPSPWSQTVHQFGSSGVPMFGGESAKVFDMAGSRSASNCPSQPQLLPQHVGVATPSLQNTVIAPRGDKFSNVAAIGYQCTGADIPADDGSGEQEGCADAEEGSMLAHGMQHDRMDDSDLYDDGDAHSPRDAAIVRRSDALEDVDGQSWQPNSIHGDEFPLDRLGLCCGSTAALPVAAIVGGDHSDVCAAHIEGASWW